MLVSTRAIVLSKQRFKDHDLIVTCYTRHFGRKSYIPKRILRSKKAKLKPA
ncbi:MAG: recombination protein O N-terminal domain-containing protein, partial [Bacteroidia bacterium]|nr:recombination protein O N-terminal domain-containing protein [Bacteroidia bacterium]